MSIRVIAVDTGYVGHQVRRPGEKPFSIPNEAAFAPRWMRKVDIAGNALPLTPQEQKQLVVVAKANETMRKQPAVEDLTEEQLEALLARKKAVKAQEESKPDEGKPVAAAKGAKGKVKPRPGEESSKPEESEVEESKPDEGKPQSTGDTKVI